MAASVKVSMAFANGATLGQFGSIIAERMKYMGETARDSVAACAVTLLKSLRAITRVAKASSIKVDVKIDNTLCPSYTTHSAKKTVCVRFKGSLQRHHGEERIALSQTPADIGAWYVYRFTDLHGAKQTKYLILAPSLSAAKAKAKSIKIKRIKYAGLAKRALGILMHKTATNQNPNDDVPQHVTRKANQLTETSEIVARSVDGKGGKYALVLHDNLRYATDAIKGGRQAVDVQMKKAMNKIVSIINRKIPDAGTFFSAKKLPTPFPELVRKRK